MPHQLFSRTLSIAAAYAISGLAFGAIAAPRMSAASAGLMSALMYSGSAQLVAITADLGTMSIAAVAVAIAAVNARYLAMGLALKGAKNFSDYWPAALMSDESWAAALPARNDPRAWSLVLARMGVPLWCVWIASTAIGTALGRQLPQGFQGVAALFSIAFLGSFIPGLARGKREVAVAGAAALLSLSLAPVLPAGWAVPVAALAASLVALRT